MTANDISQIVLAVCGVLGLVSVIVGVAFGYGAFRGRAIALAEAQKEATRRIFERLDRADRHRNADRKAIQEAGIPLPETTQVGPDGRGQRIADLPKD